MDRVESLWQQLFSKAHLQLQVFQLRDDALQVGLTCATCQCLRFKSCFCIKHKTNRRWEPCMKLWAAALFLQPSHRSEVSCITALCGHCLTSALLCCGEYLHNEVVVSTAASE